MSQQKEYFKNKQPPLNMVDASPIDPSLAATAI